MKTCELQGAALDWAVAKCERAGVTGVDSSGCVRVVGGHRFTPSTDWSQGGPIIERERIAVLCPTTGDFFDARDTKTFMLAPVYSRGSTYLEAAMRCYVASKLGDDVEIPEELL